MTNKDEQEACVIKFSTLVTKLAEVNQISNQVANKVNDEYKNFLDDVVSHNQDEFKEFDKQASLIGILQFSVGIFSSSPTEFSEILRKCISFLSILK